jgi:hypothetical protein
MRKNVGKLILAICLLCILSKIYYFTIMNNVHSAIENFKNEENRYYSVTIIKNKDNNRKEEILVKNSIIKYINQKYSVNTYCGWKNFETGEEYSIDLKNKSFSLDDELIAKRDTLINMPNLLLDMYQDNKLNVNEFLKIIYILPTIYDEQKCYKIVTKSQIVIVDRNTYLPLYSSMKTVNSNKETEDKTESIYEFQTNVVTDEDVMLPDLTDYINLNEQ